TTVKDYGFMLRTDPAYAGKAAKVSALAKDISEYLAELDLSLPQRGSLRRDCSGRHDGRPDHARTRTRDTRDVNRLEPGILLDGDMHRDD
ncbi:MAG TPA: hypothetical protein VNZ53_12005, partial [Steroidobacteraceae bacterium]|nr:hypothetical protein [Steroidobacteraceae bacterium]